MAVGVKVAAVTIFGVLFLFFGIGGFIAMSAYTNGILQDGTGIFGRSQNTSIAMNSTMQMFNTVSGTMPMLGALLVLFILFMLGFVVYRVFKGDDSQQVGPPLQ